MELEFKNIFELNNSNKRKVKRIYEEAFPKEERYPFWIVKSCAKAKGVEFQVVFEKNILVGFIYLLFYEKDIFLFYLATDKDLRGKGYGSEILKNIINEYSDRNIILCIERTDLDDDVIKKRRKEFYLKNGLKETNRFTEDNGVNYEVLCTNEKLDIKESTLSNLYKQMTGTFIGGKLISKMFNIYNVHLID